MASFVDDLSRIVVSCASGCSPYLAREIEALGLPVRGQGETAVETEGSLEDCMRLNLWVRTGHKVFWQVAGFRSDDPDELYYESTQIPWEDYLDPDGFFSIDVSVDTPTIRNDFFAAMKLKDAVADRMRAKFGRRPDSGKGDEGAALFLHWIGNKAALYLNTTGPALSKRGYRVAKVPAPMRETLAAAVVMATGWKGDTNFLNPMCGGGTLAIEAAWIAKNRAPGLTRDRFSFMDIVGYDSSLWRAMVQKAAASMRDISGITIVASDIDGGALAAAKANAKAAGVAENITFDICDVSASPVPAAPARSPASEDGGASMEADVPPASRGVIVMNPPYGTRLGDGVKLRPTYASVGEYLAANAESYDGFVFTASPELAECMGIRVKREFPFYNARLESRLLEFGGYKKVRRVGETRSDGDFVGV